MRLLLFILLVAFSTQGKSQCKTYRISAKGDTLNCTDQNGQKRGKWIIHVDPLRGNPGYDEEGEFFEDRKEGLWRRFNAMGDLVAIQNYKWGNLNGISQYYTVAGLEREESWLAMNPAKVYDTLEVRDVTKEDAYVSVVIKNDGKSMKHGTWKWYRPGSMSIIRSEVYSLNKLQEPGKDETETAKKPEPKKEKPKEVEQYEKKNSGKKVKVRDGKTG